MRVCYFIQSHKNPEQVIRLVRVIKQLSPESQILINHDFSTSHLDTSQFSDLSRVTVIQRNRPGVRGDFSLFQVYLDAIAWLFANNSDFEWITYLSGQDYPIQPLAEVESFLAQTEYDGFIRHWNVLEKANNIWGVGKSQKRYFCQYYRLPKWTGPVLDKISKVQDFTPVRFYSNFGPVIGFPAKSTPFNEQFVCYGGFIWGTLSRKCVQFLQDYLQQHPDLLRYYKRTICPEESLLPSVLINSGLFKLCNDDKRYVAEGGPDGFRILTTADYADIVHSGCHFARKFDVGRDPEILDRLDANLFQSPTTTATS